MSIRRVLLVPLVLAGCQDLGACLGGNPYRFQLATPHVTAVQATGQPADVTVQVRTEVGRACDLTLAPTDPAKVTANRTGQATIAAQGSRLPEFGAYSLVFKDRLQPGDYTYTLRAFGDQGRELAATPLSLHLSPRIQGEPTLSVDDPSSARPRLSWTPVTGHQAYQVTFTWDDELWPQSTSPESLPREATMRLAPTLTSYRVGEQVADETGQLWPLLAEVRNAAGDGLRAGLKNLEVTVSAVAQGSDSQGNSITWEHRSAAVALNPN